MPLKPQIPKTGQESVWDYPRPPRVEPTNRHIEIYFNGQMIADTARALRVLETSHPPVYYLPPDDICTDYLKPSTHSSYCEWKGWARYYDVVVGSRRAARAAWYYPDPTLGYECLQNMIAFYAQKMDLCLVDSETVQPQPGGFYGGWITKDVVGPFKGERDTAGW